MRTRTTRSKPLTSSRRARSTDDEPPRPTTRSPPTMTRSSRRRRRRARVLRLGTRGSRGRRAWFDGRAAANPDLAAYEQKLDAGAEKLVAGVIPPGRLYLVASGGLRKGSGRSTPGRRSRFRSPSARWSRSATSGTATGSCRGRPRRSSTSRSASRRWDRARSSSPRCATSSRPYIAPLSTTGGSEPKGDRETVVTLPFGAPATGEEHEELLPTSARGRPLRADASRRASRATSSSAASTASTSTRWPSSSLGSRSGWRRSTASCRSSTSITSSRSATASSAAGFTSSTTTRSGRSTARTPTAGTASEASGSSRPSRTPRRSYQRSSTRWAGRRQLFDAMDEPVDAVVDACARPVRGAPRPAARRARTGLPRTADSNEYMALKQSHGHVVRLWFWPPGDVGAPMPQTGADLTQQEQATVERLADRASVLPLGG